MFTSCLKKQKRLVSLFAACPNDESKYQKIIEMGKELPAFDPRNKVEENLVPGCQSIMYLFSKLDGDKMLFEVHSEALISAGLAAILLAVYNGETPEAILKCPPDYLEELGLNVNLTPSRANGLYSVHLRMQQDALKCLIKHTKRDKSCD